MSDTYNGYANKATWKANLEFFSEIDEELLKDLWNVSKNATDFSERLKGLLDEYIYQDNYLSIVNSAINNFMDEICFYQIACNFIHDWEMEEAS